MNVPNKIQVPANFTTDEIVSLLKLRGVAQAGLLNSSKDIRNTTVGPKVYLRGLIEFSNVCSKDCLYCGIRKSNPQITRYAASDAEILAACRFAHENRLASVVLQSGEQANPKFIHRVNYLLQKIKQQSNGELGITLSCGEQTGETYRRWFESGAHRYLLRIEASNPELYAKIHPNDSQHSYKKRLTALADLKACGYQVGTGVMIGLPFQSYEDLAADLLFFRHLDIDMCGMGPYLEHENTPLYALRDQLMSRGERFATALNMIAVLRHMMPDINIAASTALEAIDPAGREKGVAAGANVVMPNLTPSGYLEDYFLYENKPVWHSGKLQLLTKLRYTLCQTGTKIGFDEWGDSRHFFRRNSEAGLP